MFVSLNRFGFIGGDMRLDRELEKIDEMYQDTLWIVIGFLIVYYLFGSFAQTYLT